MSQSEQVRELLIERFEQDLLGPHDSDTSEEIDFAIKGPDSEYFTGKLYPKRTQLDEDEKVQVEAETGYDQVSHVVESEIQKKFDKPSSMGLSFFIESKKNEILLKATFSGGVYKSIEKKIESPLECVIKQDKSASWQVKSEQGKELLKEFEKKEDAESFASQQKKIVKKKFWKRIDIKDISTTLKIPLLQTGFPTKPIKFEEIEGLSINYKVRKWKELFQISVFIMNEHKLNKEDTFIQNNEKIFFQSKLKISAESDCSIVSIPSESGYFKEDKLNDLLFRDRQSYAIGHTCSADWEKDNDGNISVMSTWLPKYFVPDVDETGHSSIDQDYSAQKLSELDKKQLLDQLATLSSLYSKWISKEKESINGLKKEYHDVANSQADLASNLLSRIKESLLFMGSDNNLIKAFQLANRAMVKVYKWKGIEDLQWRPFQLGFVLLSLESSVNSKSKYRNTSDLLWFPTGGGKTEAYLLLMAIVLFYRRLNKGGLQFNDGLAVFTRYTLRALTLDQFKRLVGTISACEIVRKEDLNLGGKKEQPGKSFSIGMWVGQDATPNRIEDAISEPERVRVIKHCPSCGDLLKPNKESVTTKCENTTTCDIGRELGVLPLYVVDEQIYDVVPSVIIGTVDKFVQIVRRPNDARKIFSLDKEEINPPDLIIQDELHLISGPLGSVVGAIEMIIDSYCSNADDIGPKVIASTATIQRAGEQIKGLYSKDHNQFPINLTNVDDSFFAVTKKESPGRIYLGVSTACSSEQYILQSTAAILLQAIKSNKLKSFKTKDIDPFSTLVSYFNNLKQLGAATVLLQEDTKQSIAGYALRRKEDERKYDAPEELTGSADQSRLEETLSRLEIPFDNNQDHISVLVASVMISVGLDISRLGLMVVDSQPKTISEYIQATSRVGRGKIPGLILTIFNEYRPRDKSHFENFKNLHLNLYRFVENTSVTPFAPRARQKLIPAILLSLSIKELKLSKNFGINDEQAEIIREKIIPKILERIEKSDPMEVEDASIEMEDYLSKWLARGRIGILWEDKNELGSLFISQEAHAAKKAVGVIDDIAFPAPNSARNVEASVRIIARNSITTKSLEG